MLEALAQYSYFGIFLGLVLMGIGLPIPEELLIASAGVTASNGGMNPELAFLACFLGAISGDFVMYSIGRFFGQSVLREHPRIAGFLTPEREAVLEARLKRNFFGAMFVARFMPGVRSAFYLTAGIARIPVGQFVLVDSFCAAVVVTVVFGLSYAFGIRIVQFVAMFERYLAITGLVVLVALGCVYIYQKSRRVAENLDPANPQPNPGPAPTPTLESKVPAELNGEANHARLHRPEKNGQAAPGDAEGYAGKPAELSTKVGPPGE